MRERNLILVHTPTAQDVSDFKKIAAVVGKRTPEIAVFIVNNVSPDRALIDSIPDRPTLVFSPHHLMKYRPIRGRVFAGRRLSKLIQVQQLATHGLPVPKTGVLQRGMTADPDYWGTHVIVKPNQGSFGQGVRLVRTEAARLERFFEGEGVPPVFLMQEFIDTGVYAKEYRALTMFGQVLYCNEIVSRVARPEFGDAVEISDGIASNAADRASKPAYDADVLELARKTSSAFPRVPVHGMDIVREEKTGKLYLLEVNPGGNTWHLSSDHGKKLQAKLGFSFYEQFKPLLIAAECLIVASRHYAI